MANFSSRGLKSKHYFKFILSVLIGFILAYLSLLIFVDTKLFKDKSLFITHYIPNMVDYWQHFVYPISAMLVISFIMVAFDLFKNRNSYGDAQLATTKDIAKMLKKGAFERQGIILALWVGWFKSAYIRTNEPLSTLIVAPQDTGKTSTIIIPTLFSDTSSMIINDVKGELWDLTSLQRSRFGDVGLFAPSENFENSLSFNPFHKRCLPKDWDAILMHVRSLAEIIYPTEEDGQNSTEVHFNGEAKAVFMFYCLLLIHLNGETSLPEIYEAGLETSDVQEQVAFIMEEEEDLPKKVIELGNKILQKGGEEWGGVFSTFTQKLEPFSLPTIAKHLKDCDFDYLTFRQKRPFSLYIYIPANRVKMIAPIVRLMVQYLMDNFLSDRAHIDQKVTFMMDEFPRMGRMNVLKESPALQRGFNISSVFVAQDKKQVDDTYGKDAFNYFLTVCDMKAVFNQNEDTTAAKFSSLVGKTTRIKKNVSNKDLELLGSTSISDEGVPLLLPQDFMNIPKGHLYILIKQAYERPIYAKLSFWFKDKNMRSLAGAYNNFTIEDELLHLHSEKEDNNFSEKINPNNLDEPQSDDVKGKVLHTNPDLISENRDINPNETESSEKSDADLRQSEQTSDSIDSMEVKTLESTTPDDNEEKKEDEKEELTTAHGELNF